MFPFSFLLLKEDVVESEFPGPSKYIHFAENQ